MRKTLLLLALPFFAHSLFAQSWTGSGTQLYVTPASNMHVGINNSNPSYNLDVTGSIRAVGSELVQETQLGAIGAWIQGASGGNANVVMQANAGGGNAF